MAQSGRTQGNAQPGKKRSALVAGAGAAIVASAIVLIMTMSGQSPTPATDIAASENAPQCKNVLRQLVVSTNGGSGTVRLREGSYLSAPITLGTTPQTVTFPIPRSETVSPSEVIVIEGDATNVVLTSPVTSWHKEFDSVHGASAFETRWSPSKKC
jgi:hypothetical protein